MTRYAIDSATATITFDAKTSLHPVVARAPISGWVEADIDGDRFIGPGITGALEVEVDAIRAGNPLYDAETRRRIDVKAHPLITATISKADVSEHTATIEGTVAFHGAEATLEGVVELAAGPILSGEGTVDIRWWGLRPPQLLAFRVEPDVLVRVALPLTAGH